MTLVPSMIGRFASYAVRAGSVFRPNRLSILIFHRVLANADRLFPEEMNASRFETIVEALALAFDVMTLSEAMTLRELGKLPSRALVITFDDGYADNAEVAAPILRRFNLAATFFVSTGFLDGGRMWNDSIIECMRNCTESTVDLSFLGLGVRRIDSDLARRNAILAILSMVKYMTLSQRQDAIDQLCDVAGNPDLPNHLMMRSEQVLELHRLGMEIGGHTVHHPILATCDDCQAYEEIYCGRQHLRALIGGGVDTFAYPNGRYAVDYGKRDRDLVKRLGFRCAVTTESGTATPTTDHFQLPRYTPWSNQTPSWIAQLLSVRWRQSQPAAL